MDSDHQMIYKSTWEKKKKKNALAVWRGKTPYLQIIFPRGKNDVLSPTCGPGEKYRVWVLPRVELGHMIFFDRHTLRSRSI